MKGHTPHAFAPESVIEALRPTDFLTGLLVNRPDLRGVSVGSALDEAVRNVV